MTAALMDRFIDTIKWQIPQMAPDAYGAVRKTGPEPARVEVEVLRFYDDEP